jgi:hypothetical protein
MLVTDKGVRGAGLTKDAEHSLSAAGIEVTVFEDVVADPPSHIVEAAVEACRAGGIDLVLSIGGGTRSTPPSSSPISPGRRTGSTTSTASVSPRASGCRSCSRRPRPVPVRK